MDVMVKFTQGKIKPEMFWLNGREYLIKNIALIFERNDGGRKYLCFAVDTGGMMAELVMDKQDLNWRITKCQPSCTWT